MKDPEPPPIRFVGLNHVLFDTTILAMTESHPTIQLADFCFLDIVGSN